MREVIVIGSGPAGYAAAIYLARARLNPLVLAGEKAGGQLMLTTEVENYPGFAKGIQGPELMVEMRTQAEKFGAEIRNENVTKVELGGEFKKVWVGDQLEEAKVVIVTTGARAKMLNVGEERLLGRGVSTCATCDAAFFKDKITYLVGGGDVAMEDALALVKFAKRVEIVHRRDEFRASKVMQERVLGEDKVKVRWSSEVVGVKGESMLEGIKIKDVKTGKEEELEADGLFLAIGHIPDTDFFGDAIEVDSHGYVVTRMVKNGVDERKEWLEGYPTMSSVEGVFAAGDVVDFRYRQAITAAGMGVQAALDVEKYLTGRLPSW